MAIAPHGTDDVTPCRNTHLAVESRIGFCRAAIKDGYFDVYLDLARLQRVEGRYDDALASIATLTARMPEMPDYPRFHLADAWVPVLVERSIVYAQMGRFDDAMKDADALGHLTIVEALHLSARCMVRAVAGRELEQGLDDCNRAIERKSYVAAMRDSRGLIYFKLGRYKEALADYDAALDRKSGFDGSRYARGVVKLRLGDTKGGNEDIADAEARDISVAQAMAGLGVTP